MNEIIKTTTIENWPLSFWSSDEEPRVIDLELAERLGYSRPRDIRQLIERMIERGQLTSVCGTMPQTSPQGGRPSVEYHLTQAQALKVAAKSETEPADKLLDEIIRVFMLAKEGKLPGQTAKYDAIFKLLLVAADPRQWVKTFEDKFHEQMRRLKIPAPWGIQYRNLVYNHLPGGSQLLQEIDERNPRIPGYGRKSGMRRWKHHSFLSGDKGVALLKDHLISVVTLMETSETYEDFLSRFRRKFPENQDDAIKLLRVFEIKQLGLFDQHHTIS